jgi:PleD family two-component response regulator
VKNILGRWGGVKFMLLMPGTVLHEAVELSQKLYKKLATLAITTGTASVQITGRYGVSLSVLHRIISEVICGIDDAIFLAKYDG